MVVVFNHLTNRPSDFEVVPFAKRMISMIDVQLRSGIHRTGTILIMDLDTSRIGHLARYQPLRLVRAFFTQVWVSTTVVHNNIEVNDLFHESIKVGNNTKYKYVQY